MQKQNKDLCQNLKTKEEIDSCKKAVNEKKQLSWARKIAEQGEAKNCLAIINEELKQKCQDKANLEAMRREKDSSFCEKIIDKKIKKICENEKKKINMYWLLKAKNEDKIQYCDKITDNDMRDSCKDEFK